MTSVSPVVEGGGAITPQTSCFYVMDFVLLRHGLRAFTSWASCHHAMVCRCNHLLPSSRLILSYYILFLHIRKAESAHS